MPCDGSRCEWIDLPKDHPLRIEIDESEPSIYADAEAVGRAWDAIRNVNTRAFNGPILAFIAAHAELGRVRAARAQYKHLAVQPDVETGIVQLGVTGILEARDADGTPHALLGLRSHATRIFGGMWEFGPSGGVDPPPVGQSIMDADDVWRVLIDEIREEVGLPVDPDPSPPVALLTDPVGRAVELIVRVRLRRPVEELQAMIESENRTSRWEYDAVRWVSFDELNAFVRREPSIPTAVAIAGQISASS